MTRPIPILLGLFLCTSCSLAEPENWPGLKGGGPHHNASAVDVAPQQLMVRWQRPFAANPIGDQEAEQDEMRLAAGRGSLNLTWRDGKLALLGRTRTDMPEGYYCSVLDATSGALLNQLAIRANTGHQRVYRWPYNTVSMSGDNVPGIVHVHWDAETGIFFTGQGAYNAGYTAYLPLANADTYTTDTWQEAVPAYKTLAENHPGFQDPFGRTRSQMKTILGTDSEEQGLQAWAWGLSGFMPDPDAQADAKPIKYDFDLQKVYGRQGSSYYNTSGFFAVDNAGSLMGICKGKDWGHNQAGDAYLFNKHTGMKTTTVWPDEPYGANPFTRGGVLVANGRIFLAGPGQDIDGDQKMGERRPEGLLPKVDQGIQLWAYDYVEKDLQANDGYNGPGKDETIELRPAFGYVRASNYTPDPEDIDTYGQSYYETDGFYRDKAFLVDGKSVWYAWKPSQADGVELLHADEKGIEGFALGVGKGKKGAELWPKMSLAMQGKYIVYFTGHGKYRPRLIPDDIPAHLTRQIHGGKKWDELAEKAQKDYIRQAENTGVWSDTLHDPRGPAELVVFDTEKKEVVWTYAVSEHHPSIPANGFWTYLDRTQMVLAGKWAYVGWVDTTQADAVLRLLAFDITRPTSEPQEKTFALGFPSSGNSQTTLFDLIACNGMLYGLMTRSDRLWMRDPRWQEQIVIAIGTDSQGAER